MAHIAYKLLLAVLRSLVYLKRGLIFVWKKVVAFATALEYLFQRTIGFRLYKVFFLIKKSLKGILPLSWNGGLIEVFGRRGTLQIMLFIIALFIMAPQSGLYTRKDTGLPGRKTVLFTLVGPGDQNFSFEEEEIINGTIESVETPSAWRQGSLLADTGSRNGQGGVPVPEIGGTSVGGSALIKPIILPGNEGLGFDSSVPRSQVITYVVKPGDVIGSIAGKFGLNLETVLWANNLTARSRIHPGDELKILPVDGVTHTIKKGDTVGKIAKLYKTDEKKIIDFNKLRSDATDVVVGETLVVPDGVPVRAVVVTPTIKSTALRSVAAPPPSVEAPAGSGYVWPAGVYRITQYFGLRHNGLDIAGPIGTPLYATRDGIVIKSQCGWNGGYGCHIVIDHGGGYTSLYGHASQLFVNVGDPVFQGQTIGAMGSTGNSTGPHCHFEIRLNGKRQNPLRFVR